MSHVRCEEPGTYGLTLQTEEFTDNADINYGFMNLDNIYF
jgi:hypothetical protein